MIKFTMLSRRPKVREHVRRHTLDGCDFLLCNETAGIR